MTRSELIKVIPHVGDLIEMTPSSDEKSNHWFLSDDAGNERLISPGSSGIIVEKLSSKYEETSSHFDYKVLIDGVLYEDVSCNMFTVKRVIPL